MIVNITEQADDGLVVVDGGHHVRRARHGGRLDILCPGHL